MTTINKGIDLKRGIITQLCWSNVNAYRFHFKTEQCERAAFLSTKTDRMKMKQCERSLRVIPLDIHDKRSWIDLVFLTPAIPVSGAKNCNFDFTLQFQAIKPKLHDKINKKRQSRRQRGFVTLLLLWNTRGHSATGLAIRKQQQTF